VIPKVRPELGPGRGTDYFHFTLSVVCVCDHNSLS
jgi:hypothetical protein